MITFILICKWPNNKLGKMRSYEKLETVLKYVHLDIIISHMLSECPSLSQLDYLSLCFFLLSNFSPFLPLSLPFRNWHCVGPRFHQAYAPQADIKFTRTTTSEHADVAKKRLVDGAWYFWWVGDDLLLSPSILCSNPLQVLETHGLCQHW